MGPYFATVSFAHTIQLSHLFTLLTSRECQGISIASKLFSPEIQPTALAFLFVFAQIGGCIFPIITGLIASRAGVAVLQPVLCALLVATAVSWLLVPRPKESGNTALHRE